MKSWSPICRFVITLLRERRGTVAVLAAVGMTTMLGLLSLGTETGLWYATKRGLQNGADAAALSGAFELGNGGNSAAVSAAAILDARVGVVFRSRSNSSQMMAR